jgi:hypothetical protein
MKLSLHFREASGVNMRRAQSLTTKNQSPELQQLALLDRDSQAVIADFVKVEKNLASLGFFTPSSKRLKTPKAKTIQFTRYIEGKRVEAKVTIEPSVSFGLPVTADQDKLIAFLKIVEAMKQEMGTVSNPIGFTSADITHLLGKTKGGRYYEDISEWLDVMVTTTVISEGAVYFAGRRKFAKDRFHVFARAISFGDELPDGAIADRNYVWLSEWQLENINNNHLLPVDFETYKQLKNHIAKALVPTLQIWLYASREEGVFEKRYDEFCQFLNIKQYHYLSQVNQKLSPALDELVAHRYLSSWKVKSTTDQAGYKLVLHHGEKFYEDRRKRITGRTGPLRQAMAISTQGAEQGSLRFPENLAPPLSAEEHELAARLTLEFQIATIRAQQLVTTKAESVRDQLAAWIYRSVTTKNKAGWMIDAIEKEYPLPEAYLAERHKDAERKRVVEAHERIANCSLCTTTNGFIFFTTQKDGRSYSASRKCTHDAEREATIAEKIERQNV